MERRLEVSIDHITGGQAVTELLEWIAAKGETEPLFGARLLLRLVEHLLGEADLTWGWNRHMLGEALDAVCRGARRHHRPLLRQIVDRLMMANVLDYSDKLPNCGKRE